MPGERIIDLTHPIESYGDNPYQQLGENARTLIGTFATYEANGFYECALYIGDHCGTHMDAPIHFNPEGTPTDRVPLEAFCGPACVLDLSHKRAREDVTIADLEAAARQAGVSVADFRIVMLRTDRYKLWGTPAYHADLLNVTPEATEWLLRQGVKNIGMDMVTMELDRYVHFPDSGLEPNDPRRYPAHYLMRKYEWYMIENLANLDQIPTPVFRFIGLPLKIKNGSGSPIRAVAVVEED